MAMPSNVLSLHLKQTFPLKIRIFTEGEGDGIESRLPFKIVSTLCSTINMYQVKEAKYSPAFNFVSIFYSITISKK